ncbi:hypothetical protein HF086_008756 [Spodoptera exigua]|uniref:PID domain-containing protein n=1 Tax=Spodoptera exigua TaxID=7107 RepID=A0A922MBN0_SPOEX|nr:hypothetical protein HF086_008756 [Spodoptera exigua]
MSTLLFWQGKGKANGAPNGRNWIHAPDALVKGHVAYLVKPKGIEVVKDAIKKLQFTQQLKKSEAKDGAKCKKVEITISVDGVAIQEPRSNNIMYQFPLHRISYCADDKGAKKYFSFIAKGGSTVNGMNGHDGAVEKHECFELSKITYKDDLSSYLARNKLSDITEFKPPPELEKQISSLTMANGFANSNGNNFDPRAFESEPVSRFTAPSHENTLTTTPPLLAPPPKASKRHTPQQQQQQQQQQQHQQQAPAINGSDLFGSTPFSIPNQQPAPLAQPFAAPNKPNYDIADFNLQTTDSAEGSPLETMIFQ